MEAGNSDALSDEEVENDQTFQRLRAMLQALIEQAEVAVVQKTKVSGRVLTDYQPSTTTTTCSEDSDELLKDNDEGIAWWLPNQVHNRLELTFFFLVSLLWISHYSKAGDPPIHVTYAYPRQ